MRARPHVEHEHAEEDGEVEWTPFGGYLKVDDGAQVQSRQAQREQDQKGR